MGKEVLEEVSCKYRLSKRRFFERNNSFKMFKDIDEERKNQIKANADTWLDLHIFDNTMKLLLCLFNNINSPRINQRMPGKKLKEASKLFDFTSSDEEVMFYMFIADPELKALQMSYEESDTSDVKRRYFEEFRINLDPRLLKIEEVYNNKFPSIVDEFSRVRTK